MRRMLVIDDEAAICHAFQRAFSSDDTEVLTAATGAAGVEAFGQYYPDIVILDLRLPDGSGLDFFHELKSLDSRVPVLFITGHGTVDTAIEATKQGAFDYLFKPLELTELRTLVEKAFKLSHMVKVQPVIADQEGDSQAETIVGRCRAMRDVYITIGRVAPQDVNVLLLGESGTGKELVAQAIYHHSVRASNPFRVINCAAIPDTLLESEIFGHERGAFTGAESKRIGKLEQCHGGTLFLDEVGDMAPLTQAKLLRVLQDQTFERVGGNESISVDVRIIAATNRDLNQRIAERLFRADLFFRLSVVTITLPPLKDRGEDIVLLAEHFINRNSERFGKQVRTLAPETAHILLNYDWPGNVRELESVIKQSLLSSRGNVLLPDFLPSSVRSSDSSSHTISAESESTIETLVSSAIEHHTPNVYDEVIHAVERQMISQVLSFTNWHQAKAAEVLGISRVTLRSKIRSLGIVQDDFDKS